MVVIQGGSLLKERYVQSGAGVAGVKCLSLSATALTPEALLLLLYCPIAASHCLVAMPFLVAPRPLVLKS